MVFSPFYSVFISFYLFIFFIFYFYFSIFLFFAVATVVIVVVKEGVISSYVSSILIQLEHLISRCLMPSFL